MTNQEAVNMLKAKIECIKREISGIDSNCNDRYCDNCDLCYAQGTMGEQIEALKMAIEALSRSEFPNSSDMISRQAALDCVTYDVKYTTECIMALPSAQPTLYGYNVEHLIMIAEVLRKENMPPERVAEALTDIGRIVAIVRDEFEKSFRKAVEQCMT